MYPFTSDLFLSLDITVSKSSPHGYFGFRPVVQVEWPILPNKNPTLIALLSKTYISMKLRLHNY